MLTDNPVTHEQLHIDLLLAPKISSTRPTTGARIGERRLDLTTGLEWCWDGTVWLPVGLISYGTWANRPTSPVVFQRYFATDRNLEYYWDGARWPTTNQYHLNVQAEVAPPFAAVATSFTNIIPAYDQFGGFTILDAWVAFKPTSAVQSAVNFYTAGANVINASTGAVAGLTLSGGVTNTKTFITINRWWPMRLGIVPFYLGNTYSEINVTLTPSGAPGTFNATVTMLYQLVG